LNPTIRSDDEAVERLLAIQRAEEILSTNETTTIQEVTIDG